MNIISYNVNGIRAAERKGLSQWLEEEKPDVFCLQELKANRSDVDLSVFENLGYHIYWHSAEKKGYSGVGIFTKVKPNNVEIGCNMDIYDREGRVIRADFENFSVLNTYMPSGSSGDPRQDFKMQWLSDFRAYIQDLKQEIPNLLICGDYNICHQAIDIHDPVRNKNSSGFLPEEREWMTDFLNDGFIDSFRHLNKEPDQYSWWSYRSAARERNKGWRIDYHMISENLKNQLKAADILQDVKHSDHCPIKVELDVS
ncbi:exodeoxyribonuclease [Marivirga tractuosa]|uniref:Exodeoxyribonuclease III n=1 Tax=Marivirga tractuosa (strain ATCC 23168 / DSM 4126 / NBRC 15989 / NCIMB 1408 / VKM B-1430 / H-43) TaxID=643867 RepID=E4TMA1_MARTH|nr:exodeoxyribonuclease III [Marivirga tractuosa]ADR22360.1 exodeoxyribonuclease III [Marivirga tractuosa DSM 4126]BDD16969.1 exodeoxyribonuclease [Marivirga tractuosa]